MSAKLEGKAPFKNLLGHALVKAEDGREMHKSWGNAIWFDDAAEKMGVDVMRWIYASQNPETNLLFGYERGNEVRKKIIQLWNSYSFFATYASVDGFNPLKLKHKVGDLTIMDKWILSKLNVFISDSEVSLESYRVDILMKKFDLFLDDLSNWYIRRNRRRFWKTEDDKDKITAYFVLYDVLLDAIKTMAPILPFVCEEMYQNLVVGIDKSAPESIHLCSFPKPNKDLIDNQLMEKVDALRKIVEFGRSARSKSNTRIRQPLSELKFYIQNDEIADFIISEQDVVMDELNVKSITRAKSESDLVSYRVKPNLPVLGQKYGKDLKKINEQLNDSLNILDEIRNNKKFKVDENIYIIREDLLIEQDSVEGWTCSSDDTVAVGLSLNLNDSLIREGIIRDVIRHVQTMRKDANFAVEDRIKIYMELVGQVGDSIKEFKELFMSEVLAVEVIETKSGGEFSGSIEVKNQTFTIGLERVVVERK